MQNENLSHVSLYMKLHRAKMSIGKVVKNATNPHFKRSYADINALLETVQELIKATQIIFNKYIRLRDKGQVCISCQKKPLKENAGHFFNANNHWNVRFNELNVHLQCEHCNTYLSGNLIEYQRNLIHKIGIENYQQLEVEARKTRKFTKEELKELMQIYKKKIKELQLY